MTSGRPRIYTSVGSYTIAYNVSDSTTCPECAAVAEDDGEEEIFHFVNWEDENLYCDDCGRHIEPSYPKDDD